MTNRPSYPNYQARQLQSSKNILNNLLSSSLSTQIRAKESTLLQVGIDSSIDLGRSLLLLEELKHESCAPQGSDRVGNSLALDVRSTSVAGLTDGETLADVGAGDETKTSDESGSTVGENVTVQVGSDNDVVVLGLAEQLVHHRVDDLLLDRDGGVLGVGEGSLGGGAEETVGLGENVALVGDGHERGLVDALSAGVANLLSTESNVTSHAGDAETGLFRNALNSLGNLSIRTLPGSLLLDVEILSVLTDNDHINRLLGSSNGLYRTDIGVEVELLAQGNDGGGVSLDGLGRGGDGAEEGAVALLLQDVDSPVGEGGASLLESLEAGLEVYKVELEVEARGESFEDATTGGNDFLADAITGDETCNFVRVITKRMKKR